MTTTVATRHPFSQSSKFVSLHDSIKSFNIESVKAAYMFDSESINSIDQINGWSPLYKAIVYEQDQIAQFLLQHGADPNVKNNIGESALHYVCENGNSKLAQLLLSHNADPNSAQPDGNAALHVACKKNNVALIRVLLSYDCDLNLQNKSGKTALHFVAENNNLELFKYIFECGADPTIKDKWGRKAHQLTRNKAFLEIVQTVVGSEESDCDRSFLSRSSFCGDMKSSRSSFCGQEDSFIKENKYDLHRMLKNVDVSINTASTKSNSGLEDISKNFQNQLKDISKMLTGREQQVSKREEENMKRVKRLRVNSASLAKNEEYNNDQENQNPNIAYQKKSELREKLLKRIRPDEPVSIVTKSIPLLRDRFLANKEKQQQTSVDLRKLEVVKPPQPTEKPMPFFKSANSTQPLKAFDFRSPSAESVDPRSTNASSGRPSTTTPKEAKTPAKTEAQSVVQPFDPVSNTQKTQVQAAPKVKADADKVTGPAPTKESNLFSSHVYNTSNYNYNGNFEANFSMSIDVLHETRDEKEMFELLRAIHTPKNPYCNSQESKSGGSDSKDLNTQIKDIFFKKSAEKVVSEFKSDLVLQPIQEVPSTRTSLARLSVDQAFKTIEEWLQEIDLSHLTANFIDNGYKYFYEFGQDFASRAPSELIYKFGIDKVADRARIMIKLKEDFGEFEKPQLFKYPGENQRHRVEYPSVEAWLKSIGMQDYHQDFLDAGYDNLEYMIMQVGFKEHPLDESLLRDQLQIVSEKDRVEIMRNLRNFYGMSKNITMEDFQRGMHLTLFGGLGKGHVLTYLRKMMPF